MRLLTFSIDGEMRPGALVGEDGVADLGRRMGAASVRQIIAENRIAEADNAAAAADFKLSDVELEQPMPDANRIFCVGVNYMNRNEEYKDGSAAPQYPSLFMRTPASFVAHGKPLTIPRESEQLDYEGEIVLVIGKPGRRIARAEAMSHVAGLTIMNEGSIRDWIRHGKFNVTQGKNFDGTGGIGPWIETDLSQLDTDDISLETRVNGELRQQDSTASMAFPFARIIEYVSSFTRLIPGDLIATGTPTGAGARFDPPRWLKKGDVVEVTVAAIGTLTNGVEEEN
jgi:2-keto-4-pentenoate hydratase/2-oxohepta-3-ene-1,7-dioic acid hydratase in catechol pathway